MSLQKHIRIEPIYPYTEQYSIEMVHPDKVIGFIPRQELVVLVIEP